jgi:hypothetical protein
MYTDCSTLLNLSKQGGLDDINMQDTWEREDVKIKFLARNCEGQKPFGNTDIDVMITSELMINIYKV